MSSVGGRQLALTDAVDEALVRAERVRDAELELEYWIADSENKRELFVPRVDVGADYRFGTNPALSPMYAFLWQYESITSHAGNGRVGFGGLSPWGTDYSVTGAVSMDLTDERGVPLSPHYRVPVSVSLSQPILRGFGEVNLAPLQVARAQRDQSDARIAVAKQLTRIEVAIRYIELQLAQEIITVRTESLALANDSLRATEEMVQLGRAPASSLRSQEVTARIRAHELAVARSDLQAFRARLASAMNVADIDITALGQLPGPGSLPEPAALPELTRQHSPALAAARQRLSLVNIGVTTSRNALLPDLRLAFEAASIGEAGQPQCKNGFFIDGVTPCAIPPGMEGGIDRALVNVAQPRWGYLSGGLQFSIALDYGPLVAALTKAEATLARETLMVDSLETRSVAEATASLNALGFLLSQRDEAITVIRAAEAALALSREGFGAGRVSVLELIAAQEQMARAKELELRARASIAVEAVRLHASAGTLEEFIKNPPPALGR